MTSQFEYFCYGAPASAFEQYEPGRSKIQDSYWGANLARQEQALSHPLPTPNTRGVTDADKAAVFGVAA